MFVIVGMHASALHGQLRYPLFHEMSVLPSIPNLQHDSLSQLDLPRDSESHASTASELSPRVASAPLFTGAPAVPYVPAPAPQRQQLTGSRQTTAKKQPKQKGNSLITNRFSFQNWTYGTEGFADYVTPGRLFIGDNNSAETDNRLIFRYSRFKNSLESSLSDGSGNTYDQDDNVDQFVVGFEKTLDPAEQWSLEMRLPLYGTSGAFFADGFSTQNLSTGNLSGILKRQILEDEFRVISIGLGVSVPTGTDSSFIVGQEMFTVKNRATYLAPFIAGLWAPNEKWFYHAFLTVDVAASGNGIEYRDILPCGCGGGSLGELTDQTLLNVDLAAGYWWFRDRNDRVLTALSSMIEFHYVTALNDADIVSGNTSYNYVQFTSTGGNAYDSVNLTAGFDFNFLDRVNYRLATVIPVQGRFDRFFDAEFQTTINFRR